MEQVQVAPVPMEKLRRLPTSIRPKIDASDVQVPPGYVVEPLVAGLSFPTCLAFGPDGELYIGEGGCTWPTRPAMPPRILRLDRSGQLEHFTTMEFAGPRGFSVHNGRLYVSSKGGYKARVQYFDLQTREKTTLFDQIPSGGWHEPGGPIIGPHDGLLYFAHGSVSLNGVVMPAGFTVDHAKHPEISDIPGQDVTLSGNNVWMRDQTKPYPFLAETGAYKQFGTPAKKGEVVKGELWCTTGVWRSTVDGQNPELIAWGIRNPFGMAFDDSGNLYISDNDYEEKGERAIGQDPERIWHVKNASLPHGTVEQPEWFGFPDIAGDGLPVWHESHRPLRGTPPEPLLDEHPPWAGPAVWLGPPHTGLGKLEVCRTDNFGPNRRGKIFLCQFGTYAPLNSPRAEQITNGFAVVEVDPQMGTDTVFMNNKQPGPASLHPDAGGIERPVDCRFSPDSKSLYVLDFGVNRADPSKVVAFAHTGVLWRITWQGGETPTGGRL